MGLLSVPEQGLGRYRNRVYRRNREKSNQFRDLAAGMDPLPLGCKGRRCGTVSAPSEALPMKTNPWHSTERPDVLSKELFHHDNTLCLEGESIHKKQHRYGTDNRRLCKKCLSLNAAGR
jgi:hypothetical protein